MSSQPDRAPGYLREMAEGGYDPLAVGPFHRFMIPWLLEREGVDRGARVVDVGAGQGHGLLPLRAAGYENLVAVDRDPLVFGTFQELGIDTRTWDASEGRLPLEDGSAGAVLCMHLLEHLRDPTNLLTELHRVLAPDAPLFLVTPDWRRQMRTFFRDPTHVHPYDKESMARLVRMHGFEPHVSSWRARFGAGRLGLYRFFPRLGLIGDDVLAVARHAPRATGPRLVR